ncbi:hypothetical protein LOTGIDRAFT_152430 [Lottia gigantea]|uniref:Uncharacterized protein n=1 Tax=Lottia gigantea TaxID=225164 RepID=V4B4Z3_LOTGI|nr:hypothetical protein LOTGIDRAFT_152430 [Lottia gigantea]ESP05573.1 hypothetical protein LOTGIDRAFT_152430 [Lottia gigantea]
MQITTLLAVIAITVVTGQLPFRRNVGGSFAGDGLGSNFFPFPGGNFGQPNGLSVLPGSFGQAGGQFPGSLLGQQGLNEPTVTNCVTGHNGNSLEVYIRPSQPQFNPFIQFQGGSSPYEIEVRVDSSDLQGTFTVAVTDMSTDNAFCSASELGSISTNGQPQNGLLSLFTGRLNQQSAGVVGEIDLEPQTISEEYYRSNTLFRNFRDFRGMGIGLCSSVEGGDNSNFNPFFQLPLTPARQTCEMPVLCCKLGLSRDVSPGK